MIHASIVERELDPQLHIIVTRTEARRMRNKPATLKDGDQCEVIAGTHAGKSGRVEDMKTSKTGHVTVTVRQKNDVCFKTLAKNVAAKKGR